MNKFSIVLLSLFVSFSAFAAEGFSSLEEQMTGKEFSAAGLDKLSQSELDALNAWIRSKSLATLATKQGTLADASDEADDSAAETEDEEDEERTTVSSRIDGTFSGWDGQTTFTLQNGQVWVQSDKDKFYTKEVRDPVVTVEPGMFGTWRLSVEGYDEDCRVRRIQ